MWIKQRKILLENVLDASSLGGIPQVVVRFVNASPKPHPAVGRRGHEHHLVLSTLRSERLPITVFSRKI